MIQYLPLLVCSLAHDADQRQAHLPAPASTAARPACQAAPKSCIVFPLAIYFPEPLFTAFLKVLV
jgi:hypothetical protein